MPQEKEKVTKGWGFFCPLPLQICPLMTSKTNLLNQPKLQNPINLFNEPNPKSQGKWIFPPLLSFVR